MKILCFNIKTKIWIWVETGTVFLYHPKQPNDNSSAGDVGWDGWSQPCPKAVSDLDAGFLVVSAKEKGGEL